MKTKTLLSLPLILMVLGLTTHTEAVTHQTYDSKGIVGFNAGSGQQLPVDPNRPDPTFPVTPQNPDGSVPSPGGNSALTIDFASSLDFGSHAISNQDQTYTAKAQAYVNATNLTPNYVQVTDRRGTFSGWVLKVVELSQFTQVATGPQQYPVLTGAAISLSNHTPVSHTRQAAPQAPTTAQTLIPGVESQIALATSGAGAGTWVIRWGDQINLTSDGLSPDVTLFVPGATPKDAAAYQTTLKWILAELPTN
ncbi:WxL domain-containing protein [Pseudolactococcus reticulitermitis]|uniref:WxL domain-containing protein n=1 Tax=Pseudolactococcus reticulitermitis TaxID=2025039 RepID=A0A224XEM6_9LACT|nr:WxL domain-containing protein [Lactococcus reticulitermitis]GAX48031.1 hypothetical protein RsY01_1645 [Lactococcus reticulitermitis]